MILIRHQRRKLHIYKCSLCNNEIATKILSPNDCPAPLMPGPNDPYGLVKTGKLPVTYR